VLTPAGLDLAIDASRRWKSSSNEGTRSPALSPRSLIALKCGDMPLIGDLGFDFISLHYHVQFLARAHSVSLAVAKASSLYRTQEQCLLGQGLADQPTDHADLRV
jgi:hypothetical protein